MIEYSVLSALWLLPTYLTSRYFSYYLYKIGPGECINCRHFNRHRYKQREECSRCSCRNFNPKTYTSIFLAIIICLFVWPGVVGTYAYKQFTKKTDLYFTGLFMKPPPGVESKSDKIKRLELEAQRVEKVRKEYEKETNARLIAAGIDPERV